MEIVIIGNGVAGNSAAKGALRNNDTKVTIIDEETSPYYSACVLADYVSGDLPLDKVFLEDLSSPRLKRCQGKRVSGIDLSKREVVFETGSIPFDRLILATGSVPFVPPIKGLDLQGNFTLKTLDDAKSIRQWSAKHAVVVGSGMIGLEAAVALQKICQKVTLIEVMNQIGPRMFDPAVAKRAQKILEERGIDICIEESVTEVRGQNQVEAVITSKQTIEADLVVWATGVRPESSLTKNAGIKVGDNGGILVDTSMQTSVPGIYAAGDVAEYPDPLFNKKRLNQFWYYGSGQGRVAGMNAAGLRAEFPRTLQMGTVHLFDIPLAMVGYTEEDLRSRGYSPETKDIENGKHFFHQVFLNRRLVGMQVIQPNREEIRCGCRVLKLLSDKPAKTWGVIIPHIDGY